LQIVSLLPELELEDIEGKALQCHSAACGNILFKQFIASKLRAELPCFDTIDVKNSSVGESSFVCDSNMMPLPVIYLCK
jgi:hypothetical protein